MSDTEILSKIQALEKNNSATNDLIDALMNYGSTEDAKFLDKKIASGELKSMEDIARWLFARDVEQRNEAETITRKLK